MQITCNSCGKVYEDNFLDECEHCGTYNSAVDMPTGSPEIEKAADVQFLPDPEKEQLSHGSELVEEPMRANRIGNIHLVTNQELMFSSYPAAKLEDVIQFLLDCLDETKSGLPEVEVDSETEGWFDKKNKMKILQLGNRFLNIQYVIDVETVDIRSLKPYLEDPRLVKIFHNASFDLKFLRLYDIFIRHVWDTFLAECILTNGYENSKEEEETGEVSDFFSPYVKRELGLAALVYREFGHTLNKSIRGDINKMGLTESVIQYSGEDVMFLGKLKELQVKRLEESGEMRTAELENMFVVVLSKIEYHGFKLDKEKWRSLDIIHRGKLEASKEVLNNYVKNDPELSKHFVSAQLDMFRPQHVTVEWGSSKQVLKLFKFLGINTKTVDKKTKKVKDSVDEKQIKPQKSKFPIIDPYLAYKGWEKLVSTYGEGFLQNVNRYTGRIHCDFWQIVNTGRISSRNPNLQNIPSQGDEGAALRSCFIAEDGYLLGISDYSAQEPRVTADKCGDPALIDFFINGDGDIHSLVASKMYTVIEKKEVKVTNDKNNPDYPKRQVGKTLGLKMDYGGSAYTIKDELGVSMGEAQVFVDAYFEGFPMKKKYFDRVIAETLRNGYILIDNITKRRCRLPKWQRWKELEDKLQVMKDDLGSEFYKILSAESKVYKQMKSTYGEEHFLQHYKARQYADLYIFNREAFILRGDMERAAKNYPIQGTSGSMTKLAAIRVDRELVQLGYSDIVGTQGMDRIRIVNLVHDELVTEFEIELEEIANEIVQRHMVEAGRVFCKSVPMNVEPETSTYWKK